MIELVFILTFIVGVLVGWKFREYVAISNLNEVMHTIDVNKNSSIIDIKIERVDGQLFVYNRRTSEYMAHASTKSELENMLRQKYPGKNFNASYEDITKLNESV